MPDNAVLSIVGDVEEDDGFAKAERYFGSIPAGEAPKRELPEPLPPLSAPDRIEYDEDVPAPGIWFAGRLPADAPDARELAAAALASSVLGEGETSRLHRRLVRGDQVATSASVGINPLIAGNSMLIGSVRAVPGQSLDDMAAKVSEEIGRLATDGPSETELAMVRAQAERDWLDEMGTAAGRADAISGCAMLFDDPTVLNERLPLLRSLTVTDVREAAERWLLPLLNAQVRVHPAETGVPA